MTTLPIKPKILVMQYYAFKMTDYVVERNMKITNCMIKVGVAGFIIEGLPDKHVLFQQEIIETFEPLNVLVDVFQQEVVNTFCVDE